MNFEATWLAVSLLPKKSLFYNVKYLPSKTSEIQGH